LSRGWDDYGGLRLAEVSAVPLLLAEAKPRCLDERCDEVVNRFGEDGLAVVRVGVSRILDDPPFDWKSRELQRDPGKKAARGLLDRVMGTTG